LLSGKISTKLPASFLWLHPNTICLIDKEAYL
jgi:galactosamine-6-phosphate isomerase